MELIWRSILAINASVFFVSSIASALSFFISWINREHGEFQNVLAAFRIPDTFAATLYEFRYQVVIVFVVTLLLWLFGQAISNRERWAQIVKYQGNVWDNYLKFNSSVSNDLYNFNAEDDAEDKSAALKFQELIGDKAYEFLQYSLNKLSLIMEQYTGRRCHAQLKILQSDGVLITVARDNLSAHNRWIPDQRQKHQHISENTPFQAVLERSRMRHWHSNCLTGLAIFGRYFNKRHHNWRSVYNAACVVPVTRADGAGAIHKDTVDGFLCVDNRGGGFDGGPCVELLFAFARIYCYVFLLLRAQLEGDTQKGVLLMKALAFSMSNQHESVPNQQETVGQSRS